MLRMKLLVHGLLVLCGAVRLEAQLPTARQSSVNTWSARSAGGMALMGTFTVVPDTISGAVTGTWALNRTDGSMVAQGDWSAAKSSHGWTGSWRSVVSGSNHEYTGTWSASTSLRRTASLPQLFLKQSAEQIVVGGWRSRGNRGAWSIRIGA